MISGRGGTKNCFLELGDSGRVDVRPVHRVFAYTDDAFAVELEEAAERMDTPDAIGQVRDAWRSLPPDIKPEIQRTAMLLWQMRGDSLYRFLTALAGLYTQNPLGWQQALLGNRAGATHQLRFWRFSSGRVRDS